MLTITIPYGEFYDESKNEFIYVKGQTIQLEHSLVSLSKWESKWHKPFLSKLGLSREETIDYIRCMTVTQNVDASCYYGIDNDILSKVTAYIEDPMSATTITRYKTDQSKTNKIITAELIYYWMISLGIPFECRKWHLNRLLMLIEVCSIENQKAMGEKGGKMSKKETMAWNKAQNKARRAKYGSRG